VCVQRMPAVLAFPVWGSVKGLDETGKEVHIRAQATDELVPMEQRQRCLGSMLLSGCSPEWA